jgi:hypothetical protein
MGLRPHLPLDVGGVAPDAIRSDGGGARAEDEASGGSPSRSAGLTPSVMLRMTAPPLRGSGSVCHMRLPCSVREAALRMQSGATEGVRALLGKLKPPKAHLRVQLASPPQSRLRVTAPPSMAGQSHMGLRPRLPLDGGGVAPDAIRSDGGGARAGVKDEASGGSSPSVTALRALTAPPSRGSGNVRHMLVAPPAPARTPAVQGISDAAMIGAYCLEESVHRKDCTDALAPA